MRRPAAVLALFGAVVVLAAACAAQAPAPAASAGALSGTVEVSAAASLQRSFDEIARAFEAEHPGVTVQTVYDGSSTLATQIGEGAPVDVFASADEKNMAKVAAQAPDPRVFAGNTLVIAVPTGNPGGVATLADLARVPGVGAAKLERYGETFLSTLKELAREAA